MQNVTAISSTLGGVLIGLSAALMLLGLGRVAGVSGIFGGLLAQGAGDRPFRLAFVLGLVLGGLVLSRVAPELFGAPVDRSLLTVGLAGLLVGVGTRMSGGCTSGHGVCGVSRGSARSISATATFVATGMLTVFLARHILGGEP